MPAVLIEIGFIDNPKDNAIFDSKREEIVHSHCILKNKYIFKKLKNEV